MPWPTGRRVSASATATPTARPKAPTPAAGDDEWITLSVADNHQWRSLCDLMARPELAADPELAALQGRQQRHDEIDEAIARWTGEHDKYELMHTLQAAGIAAGPVLSGKDVHFDAHYRSRNFLERVEYPEERGLGTRILMGRPYRLSKTDLQIRGAAAPTFGQDNVSLLENLLGQPPAQVAQWAADTVITTIPTSGEPSPTLDPEELVARRQLAEWDPDYGSGWASDGR